MTCSKYILLIPSLLLIISCTENSTQPAGDPVVNITVDWNSIDRPEKIASGSNNKAISIGDSVTHFGARLVYIQENAVFTQSTEKSTAEDQGVITLDVPPTQQANLFAVAVTSNDTLDQVFILGTIKNLALEEGQEYTWTFEDFNWVNTHWEVPDSLKNEYSSGVITASKDDFDFKLPYLVRNPFNDSPEVEYEDLIIKVNGIGGQGGYQNGYREYFIQAQNPNQGTVNESFHSFFPYLDSDKFNLPAGRYVVEKKGQFTVSWE